MASEIINDVISMPADLVHQDLPTIDGLGDSLAHPKQNSWLALSQMAILVSLFTVGDGNIL